MAFWFFLDAIFIGIRLDLAIARGHKGFRIFILGLMLILSTLLASMSHPVGIILSGIVALYLLLSLFLIPGERIRRNGISAICFFVFMIFAYHDLVSINASDA